MTHPISKSLYYGLTKVLNVELKKPDIPKQIINLRKASITALLAIRHFKNNKEQFIGKTEKQAAKNLSKFCSKRGYHQAFPLIIGSGENSSKIHAYPSRRVIKKDDVVMIDIGLKRHRIRDYASDLTRTFFLANPTKEQKKVYEIVQKAHDLAIDAVQIGALACEIDQVARDYIKNNFNKYNIPHGVGHAVKRWDHAHPFLSPGMTYPLKENDIITIEPGIYLEGKFGVRIEDLGVVTEKGYELLTGNK